MTREEIRYFERRAQEEERRAADATDEIVRKAHEKIATEYADRVAQAKVAHATVDELLG